MKKTLLLQTALVAAAGVMLADASFAQTKEVPIGITVGGYMTQFYKVQDRDKQAQADQATQSLGQDAEVWFNVRAVLDNGLVVGGRMELEAATYQDQIDESYMFLERADTGRVELGSTDRVTGKMLYFAPNSLPGHSSTVHSEYSAAINGPLMWFANHNHDTMGINIYTAADRYFGSKAGKGIQLGFSYTPDGCEDFTQATGTGLSIAAGSGRSCGANFGTTTGGSGTANVGNQLSQQWQLAANYLESFGQFDVALYGGYVSSHIEGALAAGQTDPRVTGKQGGAQFAYNMDGGAAIQFGGGYTKEDIGITNKDRKAYALGLRYLSNGAKPGSWGIGAEYYNRSDRALNTLLKTKLDYYHAGLTYQVATGILSFAGVGVSDTDNPGAVVDRKQTFGVLGLGLTF